MKYQQKIYALLSILAFGWSAVQAACYSDAPCPCVPDVCTQAPDYRWQVEVRGLLLKPMSSSLDFAATTFAFPVNSHRWSISNFAPHYHGAFDVAFRMTCPAKATVLSLNWERFNSCTATTLQVPSIDQVAPISKSGPDITRYKKADGTVRLNCNEGNLTFGKGVHWGDALFTTIFGGVSYAQIKQDKSVTYSSLDDSYRQQYTTPITFRGAGPQVGADLLYTLCADFCLTGKFYASLLTGTSTGSSTYLSWSPVLAELIQPITAPNTQWTTVQSSTIIVPAFSERLGVAYHTTVNKCVNFSFEVGYQAQVFIGALQTTVLGTEVDSSDESVTNGGNVDARTFRPQTSNFAMSGPYISLDVSY